MRNFDCMKKSLAALGLLAVSILPINAWSHGGASVDTDQCRVQIGSHLVHFTAYQPQLTGTTEYCNTIPELGQTTVVFDYEGKALRNSLKEPVFSIRNRAPTPTGPSTPISISPMRVNIGSTSPWSTKAKRLMNILDSPWVRVRPGSQPA